MIEASPDTINDDHIRLFKKYTFDYVSIGVQTFNKEVLKKQHRPIAELKKLAATVMKLTSSGIIANTDLIGYLKTGQESDIDDLTIDLYRILNEVKPSSIVVHLNYHAPKRERKNRDVMSLLRKALHDFPEYECANSTLDFSQANSDSLDNAEYRLMKKSKPFNFYMSGKKPMIPPYGYNMYPIGYYQHMKVVLSFYYYVGYLYGTAFIGFDREKALSTAKRIFTEENTTRTKNGLETIQVDDSFFKTSTGPAQMRKILKSIQGNPLFHKPLKLVNPSYS